MKRYLHLRRVVVVGVVVAWVGWLGLHRVVDGVGVVG